MLAVRKLPEPDLLGHPVERVNDEVAVIEPAMRLVVFREDRRLEPKVQDVAALDSAEIRNPTVRRHQRVRGSNEVGPSLENERRDVSERLSEAPTPVDGQRYAVGPKTSLSLMPNTA